MEFGRDDLPDSMTAPQTIATVGPAESVQRVSARVACVAVSPTLFTLLSRALHRPRNPRRVAVTEQSTPPEHPGTDLRVCAETR